MADCRCWHKSANGYGKGCPMNSKEKESTVEIVIEALTWVVVVLVFSFS
jgi:hypothetical protein